MKNKNIFILHHVVFNPSASNAGYNSKLYHFSSKKEMMKFVYNNYGLFMKADFVYAEEVELDTNKVLGSQDLTDVLYEKHLPSKDK